MRQANARGDVPGRGEETIAGKVKATRSSNQSISNGMTHPWTKVALNGTEEYDTDNQHDTASNPERINGFVGGIGRYGERGIDIADQGVSAYQRGARAGASSASNHTKITAITWAGPGDVFFDFQTAQSSGAPLNLEQAAVSWHNSIWQLRTSTGQANSRGDVSGGGFETGDPDPVVDYLVSSAAQSIPNAAYTLITFDAAATTITIPEDGEYGMIFYGFFATNGTGNRGVDFAINGTQIPEGDLVASCGAKGAHFINPKAAKKLVAGDTVSVYAFQNSGAALNLGAGATLTIWLMRGLP